MADHMDAEGEAPQGVRSSVKDETSSLPEGRGEACEATSVMHEEVAEVEKVTEKYREGNSTGGRGEHPGMPESLPSDSQESSAVKQDEVQVSKGENCLEGQLEAAETVYREGQLETEERSIEHMQRAMLEPESQATWFTDFHADEHLNVQEEKKIVKIDYKDDEKEAEKCMGDEVTQNLTKTEALNIKSEREDNYLEMEESTTCQEVPTVSPESLTTQDSTATEDNSTLFQDSTVSHKDSTTLHEDPNVTQEASTVPPEVLTTQDPTATEVNPTLFQDSIVSKEDSTEFQDLTTSEDDYAISHKALEDPNKQNPTVMEGGSASYQDDPTTSQVDSTTCHEGSTDITEADTISLENAQHGVATFSSPEGTEVKTQPLGGELQDSEDHVATTAATTIAPSSLDITTKTSDSSSQHVAEIQGCPAESHPFSEATHDALLGDSVQQESHSTNEQDQQDGMGEEPREAHKSCSCLYAPADGAATVKCCEEKGVGSSEAENEESVNSKLKTMKEFTEKDGSEM